MPDQRGVTILEVIMLIAIIGMFAVMSVPRIGSIGRHAARTAARRIIADMRYARQLAVSKAKNHIVRFSPTGGPYTEYSIFQTEGGLEQQVGQTKQIPEQVTCAGPGEFTFSSLGSASSDGMISLTAEGDQYNINVVATTGRVY